MPARADAGEDEGWLIGYVADTHQNVSELVILDAGKFESAPLARIHIPAPIPPGFHGNFVPLG